MKLIRARAWRYFLMLLLPLFVLQGCSEPESVTDNLTVGAFFPEIRLQQLDGGRISIKHYRGKLLVLNAWATWCEPCRREMPNLQQLSDALDPERFAVIGLAQDEDDHLVREYLLDQKVTFTSYIDPAGAIATEQLGIQFFPYTLLIGPDGRFIQRISGPREWQRQDVIDLLEKAYAGDYSALQ
jgi:thiol-disulfide isomerase/thioredoxin